MNNKLGQESAFPMSETAFEKESQGYHVPDDSRGMSKRFYAACAAMQGMLANQNEAMMRMENGSLIEAAYKLADELLKQENI